MKRAERGTGHLAGRQPMLLRGRLTIASGFVLLVFALWGVLGGVGGEPEAEPLARLAGGESVGVAHVEAAPRPADPLETSIFTREPQAPVLVPANAPLELLTHLPVPWAAPDPAVARLLEVVTLPAVNGASANPLTLEYTLDPELTDSIYRIFARGRVQLGLAVVLDPETGDVLAYAATDPERLSPRAIYPAASLVKVVTTAAALEHVPGAVNRTCRFVGSPYRLTPARIVPPRRGNESTLERALAMSNNQCFAQLAVNDLGEARMLETLQRFGLLEPPAPGHEAGRAEQPNGDRFALGKLGCGLAGLQITALHAAQLAAMLADGKRKEPGWIARVSDATGQELLLPTRAPATQVLSPAVAAQLRRMMVQTTVRGTARRAFRGRESRGLLSIQVAAKTGSLSGKAPPGRYEWFIGTAPAEHPRVAIAVLIVQPARWHVSASQVGAQILNAIFCHGGPCRADHADQWRVARASDS